MWKRRWWIGTSQATLFAGNVVEIQRMVQSPDALCRSWDGRCQPDGSESNPYLVEATRLDRRL